MNDRLDKGTHDKKSIWRWILGAWLILVGAVIASFYFRMKNPGWDRLGPSAPREAALDKMQKCLEQYRSIYGSYPESLSNIPEEMIADSVYVFEYSYDHNSRKYTLSIIGALSGAGTSPSTSK